MKTRYRIACLCAGMVLTVTAGFAAGKVFTDQQSFTPWFAPSVQKMEFNGVVTGFPDGSFGPEKNVTRAELAVMLDRFATALKMPLESGPRACTMQFVSGLTLYVQDQNGRPLGGVSIAINDQDVADLPTGEGGQYALLGETSGTHTIAITKEGYSTHRESVTIEQGPCHVVTQVRTVTLYAQE